jgi:hypothetical protein
MSSDARLTAEDRLRALVEDKFFVAGQMDAQGHAAEKFRIGSGGPVLTMSRQLLQEARDALNEALRAAPASAPPTMTKTYPCGCSATGTPNIPNYCPEHRESIEDWIVREARAISGPRTHLQDVEALIQFGIRVAQYVTHPAVEPREEPTP